MARKGLRPAIASAKVSRSSFARRSGEAGRMAGSWPIECPFPFPIYIEGTERFFLAGCGFKARNGKGGLSGQLGLRGSGLAARGDYAPKNSFHLARI